MKKTLLLLTTIFVFASCEKKNATVPSAAEKSQTPAQNPDTDFISFSDEANGVSVGYKKSPADSRNIQIDVQKNGEKIQTISFSYPDDCFENAVLFDKNVVFEDLNFDGFKDMRIFLGSYGNQGVEYWQFFLWNEKNSRFEEDESFGKGALYEQIPNPKPNAGEKCVVGFSRENAAYHNYFIFEFANGKFELTHLLHEATIFDIFQLYEIEIPENAQADQTKQMLELLGLSPDLEINANETLFYAEEHFENGKRTIEKPALRPSERFCKAFGWKESDFGN